MERHEEMLSPEEQYAQLAPTLDADGFSLYVAAEEVTGLKVYEEFPYEDNRGMFEMADGHTLLRYLEAAYFGTVTWVIVPGTPYERAILGEVDKTTPEYRAFYQKICAGAAAHIKKRIGKETQNVKEPITEINKESFWDLIHDAKIACGQDMDVMLAYLKDRLVSMGPTQAQNFHDIIHAYEDLADKFGLWDAAGIMKEYGCSDDGFIDFRAWLIAQGREVYFAALADPDSLADVVPYGDCCFEQLSYVGDYPVMIDESDFQAVQEKISEKGVKYQAQGKVTPLDRLKPYFRCTCNGKMVRLGGHWQDSGKLYLKCECCGIAVTLDADATIQEVAHQFQAHKCQWPDAYAPSAEVIRLNNAINRGLERPDSPEAVMSLILQGAAARYDCCPQPISEYEPSDRPVDVDWHRFRRVVSYITVASDATVSLTFTDDNFTGKDK